ncbi:hypothetical protein L207DRAFT_640849 [Hyaloscypha variabilis F]|uniref:VOC domain-containing protein n=1 Tax=Hyaloscypha variabilis (strain UAMH 11265 / GT02V1 / F) TaxID=1149755 RepID=A0A2J6QZB0_HYAVF|nr:hypothetical protein L207DRAFT_640849 [Hyaloscypha variabilis F]
MVAHGQIAGIEIPATDVARAKFYTSTFGWKFEAPQAAHVPASKMMTFEAPGNIFTDGGVVSFVEEIPSGGAKLYINVEDMGGAMDEIVKNGGEKTSEVVKLGEVATFQFFKDTEGNHYAICTRPGK